MLFFQSAGLSRIESLDNVLAQLALTMHDAVEINITGDEINITGDEDPSGELEPGTVTSHIK